MYSRVTTTSCYIFHWIKNDSFRVYVMTPQDFSVDLSVIYVCTGFLGTCPGGSLRGRDGVINTVKRSWWGVAESAAILNNSFSLRFFSNPTFFKTLQLNPLPIVYHLLPRRTALISATVSPACDYDREVTTDYEIHNAPDILRGLIWDVCQGKLSLCHRLHPRSHKRRQSPLFFDCSSASQNCSQLIRAVMRKGGCG